MYLYFKLMDLTDEMSIITYENTDIDNIDNIFSIIDEDNNIIEDIDHISFCSIIKNIIIEEYNIRSSLLQNLTLHIDKLNQESIIHHKVRTKYISKINKLLMELNDVYNNIIKNYKNFTYKISNIEVSLLEKSYIIFSDYVNNHISNTRDIILCYYENIDSSIISIVSYIGYSNILELLKIFYNPILNRKLDIENSIEKLKNNTSNNKNIWTINDINREIHNSTTLFHILQKQFIPIEIHVKTYKEDNIPENNTILVKRFNYNTNKNNSEESNKFKFEILLENSYKITIKIKNSKYCFVALGYFKNDCTNSLIGTSQISNNYIFLKKKLLVDYVNENCNINKSFIKAYTLSMNLGDILSYKGDDLIENIQECYELYSKLANMKFEKKIDLFSESSLKDKFMMLKVLLLGPKETIKKGAMLWTLTKDQLCDNINNKSIVADILYRNLNYANQRKLKLTNKYINHELEKLKKLSNNDIDLKKQCIMNDNMSDYVKKTVLNRIEEMKNNSNENQKNKIFVETLINYPWISKNYSDEFTTIGKDIKKCRKKLESIKTEFDKRVYGQKDFKNVIEELVAKWLSNPDSMGKAIGLLGPPGVGKTLIASGLGKVLNIPYCEFHLGGVEDSAVLNGHTFTYSAAEPGLIVKKMVIAGEPRCILFFDELDKTCAKHGINEIFNVLIHATDPNTNDKFSDKFFGEIEFPLSKCIFVFSFNDAKKIDPILKDRMEIIEVSPYEVSDKIIIAKDFIVPEISKSVGIENGSIIITNTITEFIINNYTFEAGVRGLKNIIDKLFTKLNLDRIKGNGIFSNDRTFSKSKPIRITKSMIEKYLGKPKLMIEKIHLTDQIGVVNGLYATTIGSGGIIPILVYPSKTNHNKFIVEMTGKMGDVMKESVNYSWIVAKNCVKSNIIKKFYDNNSSGIHIHAPDGATPKDGPSAGSAFTTAFISRITGYPIKKEIAMTGEIGIGGNITPIGGLVHKLTGAKVAGVKFVFVCRDNLDDVKKIKEKNPSLFNIRNPNEDEDIKKIIEKSKKVKNMDDFSIQIVDTIYDIIPYCLIDEEFISNNYDYGTDLIFNKTCDINKFMSKYDYGFHNIYHN